MTPEVVTETIQRIIELLGPTAERAFAIMLRQAILVGWGDVIIGSVVALLTIVLCGLAKRCWAMYEDDSDSLGDVETIVSGVGALITGIISMCMIVSGIQHLMNPAFTAIRMMLP